MQTQRLFIAINFPEETLSEIRQIQALLKSKIIYPNVNWTRIENLHLTILFIGDTTIENLPKLVQAAELSARNIPRFNLFFDQLGKFPMEGSPRILWLGIKSNPLLIQLNKQLLNNLSFLNLSRPEQFSAHITLGRVKNLLSPSQISIIGEAIQSIKHELNPVLVSQFILNQSILKSEGPVYKPLHRVLLV